MVGVGVKNSTADLFINNCDEFLYYDDLVRAQATKAKHRGRVSASAGTPDAGASPNKGPSLEKALELVQETLEAISDERGENEHIWSSMIKQAIKRLNPGFNERAYGFRSFNDLLLEAQKRGLLKLDPDEKSGGYTVSPVE